MQGEGLYHFKATHKQAEVMEEQAEVGACTGQQGQQMPKGTCPKCILYHRLPSLAVFVDRKLGKN